MVHMARIIAQRLAARCTCLSGRIIIKIGEAIHWEILETHNDRLEKLERSNTVHGLLCGEGVSLTLMDRGQRAPFR